jgi:hypothetical protein
MNKSNAQQDENEINQRINELAQEYDSLLPGQERRSEIAHEICELRLRLQWLKRKHE